MSTENPNATQVDGTHYKADEDRIKRNAIVAKIVDGRPLEHWDVVYLMGWDYFQGNVTRYVDRFRKKNGRADLVKAAHYIQKMISTLDAEAAVEAERTQIMAEVSALIEAAQEAAERPRGRGRKAKA